MAQNAAVQADTFPKLLMRNAALYGSQPAMRQKDLGIWQSWTWAQVLDTVRACLVDKDVFASEFVIRADRGGVRIKEIPVHVIEKRPPSINLIKRVPNVLKNVAKLTYSIRIRG